MTNSTSESIHTNTSNNRAQVLLERLKTQLTSFAVLDKNQSLVGEVKDLSLDSDNRFNIVVSQPDVHKGYRLFLVNSRWVERVDSQNKAVHLSLTESDVTTLPNYQMTQSYELLQPDHHFSDTAVNLTDITNLEHDSSNTLTASSAAIAPSNQSYSSVIEDDTYVPYTTIEDAYENSSSLGASVHSVPTASYSSVTDDVVASISGNPSATMYDASYGASKSDEFTPPASTSYTSNLPDADASSVESAPLTSSDENVIRLLEEKLVVNREKRKVGEVVVRKEIQTQMLQVPVRRETLIVEQVSPEYRELARVDLSQGEISGVQQLTFDNSNTELARINLEQESEAVSKMGAVASNENGQPVVRGEFSSPRQASQMLAEIAKLLHHRCQTVRVELVLQDERLQETYQEWFTHYGAK